ncbi:MAG: hypothetical protein R3F42_12010 [Pseudomonadota bacterium]
MMIILAVATVVLKQAEPARGNHNPVAGSGCRRFALVQIRLSAVRLTCHDSARARNDLAWRAALLTEIKQRVFCAWLGTRVN